MSGVQKTDVNLLAKVTSLGARFFEKYVTSAKMNKVITNMNDVGVCDLIIATNVSQTIDFGSLKVGDHVIIIKPASGPAQFVTIAVAGDLGTAAVVGQLYIVLRPSM
tara:strand:- start:7487 stop:7807 length:321 start_codon:yes stop_codon:yes gene_type:complete